ncbi:unnamed protein product, partial [marine sediment metagenome]
MFVITQFIGLVVLHADPFHLEQEVNGTIQKVSNPALSWIQPPEIKTQQESLNMLTGLILAFIIAISLFFLLTKFKIEFVLKTWFFIVVFIALFITFYSFGKFTSIPPNWALIIPIILALPLAFIKIFKREFLVHNFTELLIYPGIATIFVPILNIYTLIILLILISIYDMWAVWHSGIMQKMAKYQINKLNIFSGFFVPYTDKKTKQKIKLLKEKYKDKKILNKNLKIQNIKINIAMLGGGDVIFPLIASGIMLKVLGLPSALFVTAGA